MIDGLAMRLSCVALATLGGCARAGGERTRLPTSPPESTETLAEEPDAPGSEASASDDGKRQVGAAPGSEELRGFPVRRAPLRRDPCGIPLAVSPEGLMTTDGVAIVQRQLVERQLLEQGEFHLGELDEETLRALRALQEKADLPMIGQPNYATIEALGIDPKTVFQRGELSCEGES